MFAQAHVQAATVNASPRKSAKPLGGQVTAKNQIGVADLHEPHSLAATPQRFVPANLIVGPFLCRGSAIDQHSASLGRPVERRRLGSA